MSQFAVNWGIKNGYLAQLNWLDEPCNTPIQRGA